MYCGDCGKYIRGIVNKVRHTLARKDRKLNYDCKRFHEVPIQKANHMLDNEMVDLSLFSPKLDRVVPLRKFMQIFRPKPLAKFNNRNHGNKSFGSDVRARKLRDRKLTHRW
jgi:hypothetical protein